MLSAERGVKWTGQVKSQTNTECTEESGDSEGQEKWRDINTGSRSHTLRWREHHSWLTAFPQAEHRRECWWTLSWLWTWALLLAATSAVLSARAETLQQFSVHFNKHMPALLSCSPFIHILPYIIVRTQLLIMSYDKWTLSKWEKSCGDRNTKIHCTCM